jgi:hypothetical protein
MATPSLSSTARGLLLGASPEPYRHHTRVAELPWAVDQGLFESLTSYPNELTPLMIGFPLPMTVRPMAAFGMNPPSLLTVKLLPKLPRAGPRR